MDKAKVFVTRRRIPAAIESLEKHFEVDVWEQSSPPPKDVVIEKVQSCHGMFTEADDQIDEEIMNAATTLKVIANRAVGMDNIDVAAATKNGIVVSNTPGVLHESCADFTFGLMLSVARNITYGDRQIRAGEWKVFDQMPYRGFDAGIVVETSIECTGEFIEHRSNRIIGSFACAGIGRFQHFVKHLGNLLRPCRLVLGIDSSLLGKKKRVCRDSQTDP